MNFRTAEPYGKKYQVSGSKYQEERVYYFSTDTCLIPATCRLILPLQLVLRLFRSLVQVQIQ